MCLSELTPSLSVSQAFINVKNLDYTDLCMRFEPVDNIIAINSNFSHKALEGYESYITKPKSEKSKRKNTSTKKVVGDGSTFNSSIEFMISHDDRVRLLRYYPRSGQIQLIGFQYIQEIVDKFINYLRNSGLDEFASVEFESGPISLLQNFKFSINIGERECINVKNLAHCLTYDQELKNSSPFPIQYAIHSLTDVHSKIAIVFRNKIRIHIWTRTGKVNILGSATELSASLLYDFLNSIFSMRYNDFVSNLPEPDKK